MKLHILKGLKISEVSLVDDGANPAARVTMMKAAVSAIPGVTAIRKALEDGPGAFALRAFDGAMADAGDSISALIAKSAPDVMDDLSRASHALGESIGMIFAGAAPEAVAGLLKQTGAQFVSMMDAEAMAKAGKAPKGKPKADGDGNDSEGADDVDAAEPGEMAKPGDKSMQDAEATPPKGKPVKKSAEDEMVDAMGVWGAAVQKAAVTFNDVHVDRKLADGVRQAIYSLQEACSSVLNDGKTASPGKAILQSVAEFEAHIESLLEVKKGASHAAGAHGNQPGTGNFAMTLNTEETPIVKSLRAEMAAMSGKIELLTKGHDTAEMIAKAKAMLPHGGPIEMLAKALSGATPDQVTAMEAVTKALGAQNAASALFGSLGNINGGGDANGGPAESPLLKAARDVAAKAKRAA